MKTKDLGFNSKLVHAGAFKDEFGSAVTPIYQTSTFSFKNAQNGADLFAGKEKGYIYSRIGNPTIEALENNEIVIFSGGTGNPYFTTDTAATLRAVEMEADVVLKGTRVDGVYTSDPEKDPGAVKYDELSFAEAIEKELKILDQTAFTMCKENHLPIIVFNMNEKGNLKDLLSGKKVGTLVKI